jgi:hypothetical protein
VTEPVIVGTAATAATVDGVTVALGEDVSSSMATDANADGAVLPHVMVADVSPESRDMTSSPVAGVLYPESVCSVYPVRGVKFVVAFVPHATAAMTVLAVKGVDDSTGAGVAPKAPVDWPPLDRTAVAPVLVIPDTRSTVSPPPVEDAWVAVNVVDEAAGISESRTNTSRTPVVENPVREESTCVYVPDWVSLTAVVPPAMPDVPAMTTIRSFAAGVATTVLLPAVVVHVVPA